MPYLMLTIGGALAVGLWAASEIRESYLERTRTSLEQQAMLLRVQFYEALASFADVTAPVRARSAELGHRITLIARDGRVLADSDKDAATMDNHARRPEVLVAMASGTGSAQRHSTTLKQDMLYLAVRVGPADTPAGIVRLAVGLARLDAQIRALYRNLALGAAVVLTLIGAICFGIARSLTRPMVQLTAAAGALADGQFDIRVDLDQPGEMGQLAETLNHTAMSVGRLVQRIHDDQRDLRAVLRSMVEAVIAVDRGMTVRVANESAARMFEFDLPTAKGRRLSEILQHDEVLRMAEEVRRNGQVVHARIGPTTAALDLEVVICSVKDDEPVGGLVLVAHDVAESARYQELRSEFVANASHELRTPLALIHGFVETLQTGAKNDPTTLDRFLQRIERNCLQLNNIVNDLLELSELDQRRAPHERLEVDLGAIAARACDNLRPAADDKRQQLELRVQDDLPGILGHARDLERALTNLIDNAIKYTEPGGWITVTVQDDARQVRASVEDTGLGIPAEDLPRIFERFFRVDKSRSKEVGGTGLGLSIVKHVVQSHGGVIDVDSKPGRGSKFTLAFAITGPASA